MDFDTLYLKVLKYLNFRPRSEKEIRDYLKKKLGNAHASSFDSAQEGNIIDIVVHKLKQQKFLNDEEFAKMWVRSRTSYKPKGERLVRIELKQKGISQEIIDEVFESSEFRVQNDLELAVEMLEKKKNKYEGMERQERFNKAGSMLARRGYDLDVIKKAIKMVFP